MLYKSMIIPIEKALRRSRTAFLKKWKYYKLLHKLHWLPCQMQSAAAIYLTFLDKKI